MCEGGTVKQHETRYCRKLIRLVWLSERKAGEARPGTRRQEQEGRQGGTGGRRRQGQGQTGEEGREVRGDRTYERKVNSMDGGQEKVERGLKETEGERER